jgi:DNA polymerase I
MKKKIVIIDANALIHRSFHALPDSLRTKDGLITNAVYGFMLVFLRVVDEFHPDYLVAAFDSKGKTFRHRFFKDYKAKRIKQPRELYQQIPLVKKVLKSFGVPFYSMKGLEADDLVGVIAKRANHGKKIKSVIVTGDADIFQLIDNQTEVFILRRGTKDVVLYDTEAIQKRFGLKPKQIVDLKALAGDQSDNIPGAQGVGEKTAITLLKKYKDIEGIYKHLKLIGGSLEKKLRESKQNVFLSYRLAKIKTDFSFKFNLKKAQFGNFDKQKVEKTLKELEFFTLLKRLNLNSEDTEKNKTKVKMSFRNVSEGEALEKELSALSKIKREIFLTVYEKPDPKICEKAIAACQFKYLALMPAGDSEILIFNGENKKLIHQVIKVISQKNIVSFGFKQEFELLELAGIFSKSALVFPKELFKIKDDVKIMAYLFEGGRKQVDFFSLSKSEGLQTENLEKLQAPVKKQTELFSGGEINNAAGDIKKYLAERLKITENFYQKYKEGNKTISQQQIKSGLFPAPAASSGNKNSKKRNLNFVYRQIEMPLVKILAEMELLGIKIDLSKLEKIELECEGEIKRKKAKIFRLAKQKFNLNSSQQMAKVFYEDLGFSTEGIKKGKNGHYSTSSQALETLAPKHEIVESVLEYRELAKLLNTYLTPLSNLVEKKDGRLHTQFNQEITTTGRLSSSNPNLQNIPVRTSIGQKIRGAFVAPKGFSLLSLDYSQIELRIAAHYSGDATMLKVFKKDEDIHAETARKINGLKKEEVTPAIRNTAKALNFGLIYGISLFGFARSANISRMKAQEFIQKYKQKFPRMFEYLEEAKKIAREKGYAETMFGRRRYIPEIKSSNWQIKASGERMAINMPFQGSAADIMKLAMVKADSYLKKNKLEDKARILLSVHDEILLEVKDSQLKTVAKDLKNIMEKAVKLAVPLRVDLKVGKNWEKLKPI